MVYAAYSILWRRNLGSTSGILPVDKEVPVVTVHIADEIAHQYEDRARAVGCDSNTLIREALISQLEDLEDLEIATQRLAEPKPALSLDQVKKNLGLAD